MNETIKNIKGRRSIRSYEDKAIPKEVLEDLVDCGRLAPSARNSQPVEYIIVTKKDILKKLSETIPNGPFIRNAVACIVVYGEENGHLVEDGCAATENIMVAAHSLGIGSCWVAGFNRVYNEDVKKILGIPKEMGMVAFIPLGYPAEKPGTRSIRNLKEIIHWEKY